MFLVPKLLQLKYCVSLLFTALLAFIIHIVFTIISFQKNRLSPLPVLALTDTEGEQKSLDLAPAPRENIPEPEKQKDVVAGGEKITFLTEEMASCKGEFSKRHNAPGSSSEMVTFGSGTARRGNIRGTLSAPASSMGAREAKIVQGKQWEPLSLSALLEYNPPVGAPGSGEFLLGKTRTWKRQ